MVEICYTNELLHNEDLYELYDGLGWNAYLQLSNEQLQRAMKNSYYVVYAYAGEQLIGTGRVISDGVTNGYLCGLGVRLNYRNRGIGKEITKKLMERCKKDHLHIQLLCSEKLIPYYESLGFTTFTVGMKQAYKNDV